jgi:hypothetical protein
MNHAASEEITRLESIKSWKLWFGVLAGPLIWLTHLIVGYSTEEWFACSPSSTHPGEMLGVGVHTFVVLITVIAAAIIAVSGLVAVSCRRQLASVAGTESVRARWMATVGVMNAVLYFLLIIGASAPILLDVCERSP